MKVFGFQGLSCGLPVWRTGSVAIRRRSDGCGYCSISSVRGLCARRWDMRQVEVALRRERYSLSGRAVKPDIRRAEGARVLPAYPMSAAVAATGVPGMDRGLGACPMG